MTKIKICGTTNLQDALFCINTGADALGFIFAKSKRKITLKQAKEIFTKLPPFISTVGVFADQTVEEVKKIENTLQLNYLQFHGDEDKNYLSNFSPQKIIKVIKIKDENSFKELIIFKDVCVFLFDTYAENSKFAGGIGKTFNHDILKNKKFAKPIILSGGLTYYNVKDLILNYKPFAVDVASGVEKFPGKKDKEKIKRFIEKVKESDLKLITNQKLRMTN